MKKLFNLSVLTASAEAVGKGDIRISTEGFLNSFEVVGKGMLGIFIVVAVLIAVVYLLNFVTKPKKSKKEDN